jgi:hypothetical protein
MQENQDSQERIRELEQKVEELEALIKSQAQTSNKNLLLKHLGQTPEEQIKNNQAAMDWAKQRLQAIKDKWGDEWEN